MNSFDYGSGETVAFVGDKSLRLRKDPFTFRAHSWHRKEDKSEQGKNWKAVSDGFGLVEPVLKRTQDVLTVLDLQSINIPQEHLPIVTVRSRIS